ncbi:MAG: hypothetical protein LC104_13145 [Bacteroidales bacterium]|nr:hypothetical protein [Bacteroidales bacterium]
MIGRRDDWFPTSVWSFDCDDPEAMNADLLQIILAERQKDTTGIVDWSIVQGWQSRKNLHLQPELEPLIRFVEMAVWEVIRFLKWDTSQGSPVINSCWSIVNPPQASTAIHTHPHAYLSGVYYVQADESSGHLFLIDPRQAAHVMAPPVTEPSPWSFNQVRYMPHPGRLLLFPPWLQHYVGPNQSPRDRVCISFNVGLEAIPSDG